MAGKVEGRLTLWGCEFTVSAECPYCGVLAAVLYEAKERVGLDRVIHCEVEEGGCDKSFVVGLPRVVPITGKTLKIERGE